MSVCMEEVITHGHKGRDVSDKQILATVATADIAKNNLGRIDRNLPQKVPQMQAAGKLYGLK